MMDNVYTKQDLISALKSLEVYFKGDDIDKMFFHYQAEIIENSYDYLLGRLKHSETERFKNA